MKLSASNYLSEPRSGIWENQLAKDLRAVSEAERLEFVNELLSRRPSIALGLAKRCLSQRASFEALLERGLKEADASSIEEWLECLTPKLGPRRVLACLRRLLPDYRQKIKAAAYFLGGLGCSEEELNSLLAA